MPRLSWHSRLIKSKLSSSRMLANIHPQSENSQPLESVKRSNGKVEVFGSVMRFYTPHAHPRSRQIVSLRIQLQ
jgi:hypothetical protein